MKQYHITKMEYLYQTVTRTSIVSDFIYRIWFKCYLPFINRLCQTFDFNHVVLKPFRILKDPNVGVWVRACTAMFKSVYVQACVFMSALPWVFVCVFGVCVCVSAYAFMSLVGMYVCECVRVLPCVRA